MSAKAQRQPKPATLSDRQLRRIEAARREQDAAAALALANGVVRDKDGKPSGIADAALEHITRLAAGGAHQDLIASHLGLSRKQFKTLIGSGEAPTPLRLAFERGFAEHEANLDAQLLEHGKRWAPSLMFYAKARLRWREQESVVDVRNEDNRRIQITLPAPLGFGDMLRGLGQTEVEDFRSPRNRSIPLEDVLPDYAKVPALPAPADDAKPVDAEFTEVAPPEPPSGLALILQKQESRDASAPSP